jgi:quercetin dioxygenase-like cupin family protein
MEHSLEGWDIARAGDVDWVSWGSDGNARAKLLGTADGFQVALVEADAGYASGTHEHPHPEFLYVLDGCVRTQGQVLERGDTSAAAAGTSHTDFATELGATYLLIFKF